MWLTNAAIVDGRLFSGVICRESATFVLGLSNYPPNPLIMYADVPVAVSYGLLELVPGSVPEEDLIRLGNDLYVTNAERTICDLITGGSSEEYIYQSLENYQCKKDINSLLAYAGNRGVKGKVEEYLNKLDEYLGE